MKHTRYFSLFIFFILSHTNISAQTTQNVAYSKGPSSSITAAGGKITKIVVSSGGLNYNAFRGTTGEPITGNVTTSVCNHLNMGYQGLPDSSCATVWVEKIKDEAILAKVYPNPAYNEVNLVIEGYNPAQNLQLELVNVLGQNCHYRPIQNAMETINLHDMAAGVYFVVIRNDKGKAVYAAQIIKKNS